MAVVIDTHLHAVSDDGARYPRLPTAEPVAAGLSATADEHLVAMRDAGVDAAVLVQWNSRHGFDNGYIADAAAEHPDRFSSVCSVDVTATDVASTFAGWIEGRGIRGVRLFNRVDFPSTGPGPDPRLNDLAVDVSPSLDVVDAAVGYGVPITVMSSVRGLAELARLARLRPAVPLVVDHLGSANDIGPLVELAALPNVVLKFSTGVLTHGRDDPASIARGREFLSQVARLFGVERLLWGSNYPQSPAPLARLAQLGWDVLDFLDASERDAVMGTNALRYWPSLGAAGA